MTDLHTHILPGMDDGAPDVQTALAMLKAEAEQGIKTVALTPHFYRGRERASDFLKRRSRAMADLQEAVEGTEHPRLILSAEVAYVPGIADMEELDRFCYEGTKTVLIEPPMTEWNAEMFRQLYAIEGRRGLTPMIAHLDRYLGTQKRANIEQLLDAGFPLQISNAAVVHFIGRNRALELLTDYNAILVSDCHNTTTRPPDFDRASKVLQKKLDVDAGAFCRMPECFYGEDE